MTLKLTKLARKTIRDYFDNKKFNPDKNTKELYKEKKACFVTLTLNGELKGCIGSLKPEKELWKDVQDNAINAAIHDFRFSRLTEEEFLKIKIEVSVLSLPKKIEAVNEKDLLMRINPGRGYILEKEGVSSTFLPQVWKQIPDKIQFLEQLSLKAGLNRNAWKTAEIWSYTVNSEKEK